MCKNRLLSVLICLAMLVAAGGARAQTDDYQTIWHTSGADSSSKLGYHLVAAGDQNMDGYDDILVANPGTGEVFLYYGGNPMDTIPDMIFTKDHRVNYGRLPYECRDLNGDTYPDFTIGADNNTWPEKVFVYFGGELLDNQVDLTIEPEQIGSNFGAEITMGDFNGDGCTDLVVGARGHSVSDGVGKLYVYYGGADFDSIPDFTITGSIDSSGMHDFGSSISCSGDVNNDGFDDILTDGRRAWLGISLGRMMFLGGSDPDTIPDWEFRTYQGDPYYPSSGTFILPDFTDDGYDEIVMGMLDAGWCSAWVFYGGEEVDTTWNLWLSCWGGSQNGCAYAGDINNDSWPDVLVGNKASGKIHVFFLSPFWASAGVKFNDFYISYPGIGSNRCMGFAEDVNGDEVDDFMYASWWENMRGEVFISSDPSLSSVEPFKIQNSKFIIFPAYPNPFN